MDLGFLLQILAIFGPHLGFYEISEWQHCLWRIFFFVLLIKRFKLHRLSIYLSKLFLYLYLSVYAISLSVSIYLSRLFLYLYLSVYIYISILHLSRLFLYLYLFISIFLSVYLSLSIFLSIYLCLTM